MLKPIGNRVIVDLSEKEEVTKSGIILTESAKEKPSEGKVIAVGSGKLLENGERATVEVSVGDTVVFSKFSGTEVKHNDKEYLILNESDILAISE